VNEASASSSHLFNFLGGHTVVYGYQFEDISYDDTYGYGGPDFQLPNLAEFGAAAGAIQQVHNGIYPFARRVTYTLLNVFALKMAGVFMFSTSTIALRTGIFPRWVAFAGFACGVVLLVVISNWLWIALLFPIWTLLVSTQILIAGKERCR
jgi:hypothetical protein